MRANRALAGISALFVATSLLTVPVAALAAESGAPQEDRITLKPAPPDDGATARRSKKAGTVAAPKRDNPPLARARVITDIRDVANCAKDTDRSWVAIPGPGDVRVAGWAQCFGGQWTLDVVAGSGHVGGMNLRSEDFGGQISIAKGQEPRSSVRVALPWAASMLPGGYVTAFLDLAPQGRELAGTVSVTDAAKAGRIEMSGPLLPSGTFVLKARGVVSFAGSAVPMTGLYRSGSNGVRGRGTKPTWNLSGTGKAVRVPGATFAPPRLVLSSAVPGINGMGRVTIETYDLSSPVRLRVIDGDSWGATLLRPTGRDLKDPRLPGLTLQGQEAEGTITSVRGRILWNIVMPMRLIDTKLALRGTATLTGPTRLRISPTGGVGDPFLPVTADMLKSPLNSPIGRVMSAT